MKYLLLILFVSLAGVWAEKDNRINHAPTSMDDITKGKHAETNAEYAVKLVDVTQNKYITVARDKNGELMLDANRAYVRFEPKAGGWVCDITLPNKKFARPSQYLSADSRIPAEWVGGKKGDVFEYLGLEKKGFEFNWRKLTADEKPSDRYWMTEILPDGKTREVKYDNDGKSRLSDLFTSPKSVPNPPFPVPTESSEAK